MARYLRDTTPFAFVQGFFEHWNGSGGRTHETNAGWNEAYDKGMSLADRLRGRS